MVGITRTRVARRASALDRASRYDATAPARHFDFLLVGTVLALSLFGLVMIWSASRNRIPGDEFYFVKRQAMFVVLGVATMIAVISVDYRRLRDHSLLFYLGTVAILFLVISPLGSNIKGNQAWFQLPGGFTMQPSEFAKFGIIVALAGYCNQYRGELDAWRLATVLALAAVPLGLVMLQPDFGTLMVLIVIIVGLLIVAGVTGRQAVVLALLAATGVFVMVNVGLVKQYQIDRLNFLDRANTTAQSSGYNQEQSIRAIANGRTTGQGIGQGASTQGSFVPEQHTDFIFTAVGEELGFIGAAALLGLFAIVMWRTWRTARLARDFFGALVCVGVLSMLAFQVFENVGMTVGIMPVTGIPLPFMSYGGSSMIASFACVGLVANIGMRRFQ
ncbi:MAG: FtsW/RodA/SpoVE family cell cycle protein [Acidimicrobiia bacterium]